MGFSARATARLGAACSLLVCWLLWAACDGGERASPRKPQAAAVGYGLRSVRYAVRFSQEGTQRSQRGLSVGVANGATLTLREARVVSHSAELLPCAAQATRPRGALRLDALLGLPIAHAGHTSRVDPSFVNAQRVHDLIAEQTASLLGARALPEGTRYCGFRYLIASKDRTSSTDSSIMAGLTLSLSGSVSSPDGQTRELSVTTQLAHGKSFALADMMLGRGEQGGHLQVEVQHSMARIFEGIDWLHAEEKDIARSVLTNLLAQVRMRALSVATPATD